MRALKFLVITMALLIVAGLALVAYGIVKRVGDPATGTAASAFGETELALPPGARVVDVTAGDGRLVLRIEDAFGRQWLYLLDPSSGALLGTIALTPAP